MNDLVPLLLTGTLLAAGYALVPGPVNTETARRALHAGFRPALAVQLGALAGDVPWAGMCLTGVVVLLRHDVLATGLAFTGAAVLLLLAHSAFRAALQRDMPAPAAVTGSAWRTGFLLSAASPGAIGFWTGVGGGALATSQGTGQAEIWVLLGSYTVASALTGAVMAALAAQGQRWARGRLRRWVDGLGGCALAWTGLHLLWGALA